MSNEAKAATPEAERIIVVTREDDNAIRGVGEELVTKSLQLDKLRDSFKAFMGKLESILEADTLQNGPFHLAEVQFKAEVSANGQFKLLGSGVGVTANSGITFVIRRTGMPPTP